MEVKSGKWGREDVFKFFGWTQYLGVNLRQTDLQEFSELAFRDDTSRRMAIDYNAAVRLLDCNDQVLAGQQQ